MNNSAEDQLKLNIFALPNQTTLLFGVIVAVILGAVLAGSITIAPVSIRPLAILLLILPLRAFLARPEREFARYHEVSKRSLFETLQDEIDSLANDLELPRTPKLRVFEENIGLHASGTFRHWYLVVSLEEAMELQAALQQPGTEQQIRAKLLHELYHFKTGDYWQMGYARELLRLTFLVMLWAFAFSLGYGILLLMAKPEIMRLQPVALLEQGISSAPPPIHDLLASLKPVLAAKITPLMEQARQKAATISIPLVVNFAIGATYPFVFMGLVLWGVYWRKLWRVREFYADAGSAQRQQSMAHLAALFPPFEAKQEKRGRLRRFLAFHPDPSERIAALRQPQRVFGAWTSTALLAGSLAFILEVLMVTPLTLLYVGMLPMHFPTLAVMLIIALNYLIPTLAQGKAFAMDLLKIIGVVTLVRLLFFLGAIALLQFFLSTSPLTLAKMLTVASSVAARYAGTEALEIIDPYTFVPETAAKNLAQILVVFCLLVVMLTLAALLLRRMFTWYAFPQVKRRLMPAAYSVIALFCACLGLMILPFVSAVLLHPENLHNPVYLGVESLGVILTLIGLGLFLYADRQYAKRCPECNAPVPGAYWPGKRCGACGTLLHSWLIAEYEVDRILP